MTVNAFDSGLALAERIRNGETSCVDALEFYLARAKQHNEALNAIIEFREEEARAEARELDAALVRGEIRGPLHGVPMTVKESYDVAGMRTTRGNPIWKDQVASEDALSITRLKTAGVVIFGKTNVPLNLADFQSYNDIYGTTNNPWDQGRTAGGSSGGSAVVMAAGLAGVETGSDIGGSIRNPSHYNGVFGHKPTWGLLPPRGHAAPGVLAQSDLTVIGPLARSAADLEVLTMAMAGPDEIHAAGYQLALQPCAAASLGDLKVAVMISDDAAPVDSATRARVELVAETIRAAGGTVDTTARPDFDLAGAHHTYQTLLWSVMAARNPADAYGELQAAAAALDPDDDSDQARLLRAQTSTYRDYALANEERTHCRWAWHEFFKEWDVLIAPMMATAAFEHDHGPMGRRTIRVDNDERPYFEQLFWAGLAINSYLPATVIPTGGHPAAGGGLPIGLQIIGPEFGDLKTIGVAKLLEGAGFGFTPPPGY
jgi:amidase